MPRAELTMHDSLNRPSLKAFQGVGAPETLGAGEPHNACGAPFPKLQGGSEAAACSRCGSGQRMRRTLCISYRCHLAAVKVTQAHGTAVAHDAQAARCM